MIQFFINNIQEDFVDTENFGFYKYPPVKIILGYLFCFILFF